MRVILIFYRNVDAVAIGVSILCCVSLYKSQSGYAIPLLLLFKVVVNFLLGWYIYLFRQEQFYFFHNLGYSKGELFVKCFLLDISIALSLMLITIKLF